MADRPATVRAPAGPVFRIGRMPDPFALPDWIYAKPDGTFGGRFDDPSGRKGVPPDRRYRTLYLATSASGAFGEVLAHFRPDLYLLTALGVPATAGIVSEAWRATHRLGAIVLDPGAVFVDIGDARTLAALRPLLAPIAESLGLRDVDLSAVTGPARLLTQAAARHLYQQHDRAGDPRYGGIRYTSRLDHAWECWAVWPDRARHRVSRVDTVSANDPALLEAAAALGLRVS